MTVNSSKSLGTLQEVIFVLSSEINVAKLFNSILEISKVDHIPYAREYNI